MLLDLIQAKSNNQQNLVRSKSQNKTGQDGMNI